MEIVNCVEQRRRWQGEDKLLIVAEVQAPSVSTCPAPGEGHPMDRGKSSPVQDRR